MSLGSLAPGMPVCDRFCQLSPSILDSRLYSEDSSGRNWPHAGEGQSSGCDGPVVSNSFRAAVQASGVCSQAKDAEQRWQ